MRIDVARLRLYPVKGLRGSDIERSTVERRGLQHDRRFLVVGQDRVFLSLRSTTEMARVEALVDGGSLSLKKEGLGEISVGLTTEGPLERVRVWKKWVGGRHVSRETDEWLSKALGQRCRLYWMPEGARRRVAAPFNSGDDLVSFADAMPILVASESSIEDLNRRLPSPVPIERFRPNIILRGCAPFEEDEWSRIRIGAVVLRAGKKCNRCLVTTTDHLTGERLGPEPLRTLAEFRRNGAGVAFGMYYIPESLGTIAVGDACSITR